jgi:hypothetical protein
VDSKIISAEMSGARDRDRRRHLLPLEDERILAPSIRWYQRRYAFGVEMAFLVLVIVAWQAIRIPLEGRVDLAVQHGRTILELENKLSLHVEPALIRFGQNPSVGSVLRVAYNNLHIPVLFAFFAFVHVIAPQRYSFLRSVLVFSFLPAVLVIGLYPTAPPRWLPELGLGGPPAQEQLSGTLPALLQNSTAAAASQHFAVSVLVGLGVLWLFPRSRVAWLIALYPLLIFIVILSTGNHYVLHCVVGAATLVFSTCVARLLHGQPPAESAAAPPASFTLRLVLGSAALAFGVLSLGSPTTDVWRSTVPGALCLITATTVITRACRSGAHRGSGAVSGGRTHQPQSIHAGRL